MHFSELKEIKYQILGTNRYQIEHQQKMLIDIE